MTRIPLSPETIADAAAFAATFDAEWRRMSDVLERLENQPGHPLHKMRQELERQRIATAGDQALADLARPSARYVARPAPTGAHRW